MTLRQKIAYLFNDDYVGMRKKSMVLLSILLIYTMLTWLWAWYALYDQPFLLSTAILAYTFGLRHAVDADHIAAIDNVTRKLMQEGKRPISLGFFFSLGHSTVVFIATIVVAMVTSTMTHNGFSAWQETANAICTSISAIFLLLIAIGNLLILFSIGKSLQRVRRGASYPEDGRDGFIAHRGFLSRYFQMFFRLVTQSWHMYFVGFLFGIGFDTATEIVLLGIAASQTMNGVSPWTILIFPALFTAGMTLVDTMDCLIMLGAYGWAFMKPIRKLFYNWIITFVSVVVALLIGGLEALSVIADQFQLKGVIGDTVLALNGKMDYLGFYMIAVFVFCWCISLGLYKYLKLEKSVGLMTHR